MQDVTYFNSNHKNYKMVFLAQKDSILRKLHILQQEKNSKDSWSITWRQGMILSELIELYSPENILEIGTSLGFSTLCIARGLQDSSTITTLEIDENRYGSSKKLFDSLNLSSSIDSLHCGFFESLDLLKKKPLFDFVFLDALQPKYLEVILFLRNNNLVSSSCIFVCDNILSHSYMDEFVSIISSQVKFSEIIELDSGFFVFEF